MSKRWIGGLVIVGAAIALIGGALFASRSSLFDARRISVTGNIHLDAGEVERLAGVDRSTNVLWLDAGSVERRLLENPWISRADVSTSFPWTVDISVVERTPVGVESSGGSSLLLATDGTTLGDAGANPRLPEISAGAGSAADAAKALGALPPDLLKEVVSATGSPDSTVTMTLRGGTTVSFGTLERATSKVQSLMAVLQWATSHHEGLLSVDVSAPSAPTARLRSGAVVAP